ncbi:MAG: hypothetical protein QOF01_1439, partial [Thermomicrobiales bacterium]|nr:hypothetical protein [Thermomicrobiales bacterium]
VAFARVYDLRRIPPPAWLIEDSPCSWRFGDKVALVGYGPHRPVAGEQLGPNEQAVEVVFQTRETGGSPAAYRLDGALVPRSDGDAPIPLTTTFTLNPDRGLLAKAIRTVQLPAGRTLGDYWLQAAVIDPATGQSLPAIHLATSAPSDRAGRAEC